MEDVASMALRSSCDRCHHQKLKCTPQDLGPRAGNCERCVRAGVSCIFSRRRRSKGAAGATAARSPANDTAVDDTAIDDTVASDSSLSQTNLSLLDLTPDLLSLARPSPDMLDGHMEFDWTGILSPQATLAVPLTQASEDKFVDPTPSSCRGLLDLAAQLTAALESLRAKHNYGEAPDGAILDDLPIGRVVHLLQFFTEKVYEFVVHDGDKPAVFLLLSCTGLIARVCSLTVVRLQTHVDCSAATAVSCNQFSVSHAIHQSGFTPSVCLGTLPAIDQTTYRIHVSLGMLLDLLRQAEEAFSRYQCTSRKFASGLGLDLHLACSPCDGLAAVVDSAYSELKAVVTEATELQRLLRRKHGL